MGYSIMALDPQDQAPLGKLVDGIPHRLVQDCSRTFSAIREAPAVSEFQELVVDGQNTMFPVYSVPVGEADNAFKHAIINIIEDNVKKQNQI